MDPAMPRLMGGAAFADLVLWLAFVVTHSLNTQFEGRKPVVLVINHWVGSDPQGGIRCRRKIMSYLFIGKFGSTGNRILIQCLRSDVDISWPDHRPVVDLRP